MTDMDAACLLKELRDYNMAGTLVTPQMDRFDSIFQCAFDRAVRALEQRAGIEDPEYVRNPNGSYSIREPAGTKPETPEPDAAPETGTKFLILNPARSEAVQVYWRPARSGYTFRIHEAGIYSEAETNMIASRTSPDHARPVPVTPEIAARMMDSLNLYQSTLASKFETSKQDYDREMLNCDLYRLMIRRLQDEGLA